MSEYSRPTASSAGPRTRTGVQLKEIRRIPSESTLIKHRDPPALPKAVFDVLDPVTLHQLATAAEQIRSLCGTLPEESWWAQVVPITSDLDDPAAAMAELERRIVNYSKSDPASHVMYALGEASGRPSALVTDLLPANPHREPMLQIRDLMLFDLHTAMSAWYLTACWRAAELLDFLLTELAEWSVVAAAAHSRSLLEGIAAFVVEGARIEAAWAEMKRSGPPDWPDAFRFRIELQAVLGQSLFGTRLESLTGGNAALERTNVMTFLKRFFKGQERDDLMDQYEWLCDAVHPSFGFQTVYTRMRLGTPLKSSAQMFIGRRAFPARVDSSVLRPDVAQAAVQLAELAATSFLEASMRTNRVVWDYGLTTEVAFIKLPPYYGHVANPPSRNELCACGSGKKSKSCLHVWGQQMPG